MDYLLSSKAAAGFEYLEQTGSTNRDLLDRSSELPEFFVLATDHQTAGRGRMGRSWEAGPKSSIMASVLLRPSFNDPAGFGWLPLITALAITKALNTLGVSATVKWPNDVLVNSKKISGILAEASEDLKVVVVGFGINIFQNQTQLPVETATSLAMVTSQNIDRDLLLSNVITKLRGIYQGFVAAEGNADASGVRSELIGLSATIGQEVSIEFPDGKKANGKAMDIDQTGRLVVQTQTETLKVAAGDVLHLRPAARENS